MCVHVGVNRCLYAHVCVLVCVCVCVCARAQEKDQLFTKEAKLKTELEELRKQRREQH